MPSLRKRIAAGAIVGDGIRAYVVEKITAESIYLRSHPESGRRELENGILRIIPCEVVEKIIAGIEDGKIALSDVIRKTRKDANLDDIFTTLGLDYDTFLLGYDTTLYKLCEYWFNNTDLVSIPQGSTPLPKPFLLLAGISGTGKSRFVREQALAHGASLENFALVAVRPDWHEPSDLLGYVSRIGGSPQYVATDFLKFLVRAWVDATTSASSKEALVYKDVGAMVPHWLCLDEMNLAPVEQYFSDYLAVIESRKWLGDQYQCGSLLKPLAFQGVDAAALRESLGVADAAHDGLWAYFAEHGIAVPPNLIVAGTVNMDETTHGFSRKVLDRAFTIDFGAFYPNDFEQYFKPTTTVNTLTFPVFSQVTQQDLVGVLADPDGAKSTAFLKALNGILAGTPFELAFRALNELLIAVVCFNPKDDIELQAVWDDFLMTKVLPRIAGDMSKLGAGQDTNVLERLMALLSSSYLQGIWQAGDLAKLRPDFLRTDSATGKACQIACRAETKMAWMQARLEANSFTSFWP